MHYFNQLIVIKQHNFIEKFSKKYKIIDTFSIKALVFFNVSIEDIQFASMRGAGK